MEFPARQVYSPESFRDTFLSVKTSMSLSVVFNPAVWMEKCQIRNSLSETLSDLTSVVLSYSFLDDSHQIFVSPFVERFIHVLKQPCFKSHKLMSEQSNLSFLVGKN